VLFLLVKGISRTGNKVSLTDKISFHILDPCKSKFLLIHLAGAAENDRRLGGKRRIALSQMYCRACIMPE
jgi:hypothetical protein